MPSHVLQGEKIKLHVIDQGENVKRLGQILRHLTKQNNNETVEKITSPKTDDTSRTKGDENSLLIN